MGQDGLTSSVKPSMHLDVLKTRARIKYNLRKVVVRLPVFLALRSTETHEDKIIVGCGKCLGVGFLDIKEAEFLHLPNFPCYLFGLFCVTVDEPRSGHEPEGNIRIVLEQVGCLRRRYV